MITNHPDAACRGFPNEWFVPEKPDAVKRVKKIPPPTPAERKALGICAGCKIKKECYKFAVENEYQGIWGGTRYQERLMALEQVRHRAV